MIPRIRQLRPAPAFLLAALSLIVVGVAVSAARCPTKDPVGFGLLEFSGGENAVALELDSAIGINPLFTWAELEPEEGAFNWAPLDGALTAAHDAGLKVVPRVYTNEGDFSQATPDWVFEAGAQAYQLNAGSLQWQPVPTDPVFEEKFGTFLEAFGDRYNGNEDIEFVQTNAGMGAYGEMVWWLDEEHRPPGYSAREHIATVQYWVDRWREAFPQTHLALMQNFLGANIVETVTAYAVGRGFYLQSNSAAQSSEASAVLVEHDGETKIIIEIENQGCDTATGSAFEDLIGRLFSRGFSVDYLVVCPDTLEDPVASQQAYDALRKPD